MLVHIAGGLVPASHKLRVVVSASPVARSGAGVVGADFIASRAAIRSVASAAAVPRPPLDERSAGISRASSASAASTAGRGYVLLG